MLVTFDADQALLHATALRHAPTLPPRVSVQLSAAVDALTDPLRPPHLTAVDPRRTGDLHAVLRAVADQLRRKAQQTTDPRQALDAAAATRELTDALRLLEASATIPAATTGRHPGEPGAVAPAHPTVSADRAARPAGPAT